MNILLTYLLIVFGCGSVAGYNHGSTGRLTHLKSDSSNCTLSFDVPAKFNIRDCNNTEFNVLHRPTGDFPLFTLNGKGCSLNLDLTINNVSAKVNVASVLSYSVKNGNLFLDNLDAKTEVQKNFLDDNRTFTKVKISYTKDPSCKGSDFTLDGHIKERSEWMESKTKAELLFGRHTWAPFIVTVIVLIFSSMFSLSCFFCLRNIKRRNARQAKAKGNGSDESDGSDGSDSSGDVTKNKKDKKKLKMDKKSKKTKESQLITAKSKKDDKKSKKSKEEDKEDKKDKKEKKDKKDKKSKIQKEKTKKSKMEEKKKDKTKKSKKDPSKKSAEKDDDGFDPVSQFNGAL